MHDYRELRVRFARDPAGGFTIFATGPTGEAAGRFEPPFSDLELENFVLRVSRTRQGVRRVDSPEMQHVSRFGGMMFDALFQGDVRDLYHESLSEARVQSKGLRITLALTEAPELMQLPWEYLYDAPNFLSISTWTPVVRYLDLPRARSPLEVEHPLRVLALVSSPTDAVVLDVENEKAKLEGALGRLIERNAVEITWLEAATLRELQRALRRGPYHVFHFIGHGGYDEGLDDGVLLLEDENQLGARVSGVQVGTMLADHTSLRLAVLNACEGARTSREDPFAGVACTLVQREIPAVVAMQFEITDRAAIIFAEELYTALADGYPVDAALAEARKAIYADRNDIEWGTPVLFMRVQDGRIFDLPAAGSNGGAVVDDDTGGAGGDEPSRLRAAIRRVARRRRWVAAAAGLVIVGIAAAVGAIVIGGSGSEDDWSVLRADGAGMAGPGRQEITDVASTGRQDTRAVAVGVSASSPAVWTYEDSGLRKDDAFDEKGIIRAVATRGSFAVAVGARKRGDLDAGVWTHTLGSNGGWQQRCTDEAACGDSGGERGSQEMWGITVRREGGFVAVGRERLATGDESGFRAVVWISNDGRSWERVATIGADSPGSQVMNDVVQSPLGYVAVGRDRWHAAVWTSPDGREWSPVPRSGNGLVGERLTRELEINAVARWPDRIVAVGRETAGREAAAVWISENGGRRWSRQSSPAFDNRGQVMHGVVRTQDGYVAVGRDQRGGAQVAAAWRASPDGAHWRAMESGSFLGNSPSAINAVALVGSDLVAGGEAQSSDPADKQDARVWLGPKG
jgi:hypothetical protein